MDILTSLSEAEGWKANITAFALIYGAVVTVIFIVLVVVGLLFEILNAGYRRTAATVANGKN